MMNTEEMIIQSISKERIKYNNNKTIYCIQRKFIQFNDD